MNKIDDVLLVVHLMKITHNQFGRKDDVDVFRYSVTFLWLLCQDESIAEVSLIRGCSLQLCCTFF